MVVGTEAAEVGAGAGGALTDSALDAGRAVGGGVGVVARLTLEALLVGGASVAVGDVAKEAFVGEGHVGETALGTDIS